MQAIRIFQPLWYELHKKRFSSLAFRNSSESRGGGISVIDLDCVRDSGRPICLHIREYYAKVSSEPAVYWRFSTDALPSGFSIEAQRSETGDACHRNLHGLSDSAAKQALIQGTRALSGVFVCGASGPHPATHEEMVALRAKVEASLQEEC